MYDEDRWPSGYAGGLVTRNPDFRLHLMVMESISINDLKILNLSEVFVFNIEIIENEIKSYKRINSIDEADLNKIWVMTLKL